jgi:hypothetical protein
MFHHQLIQFVDGRAMNHGTVFHGEDFPSQPFPEVPHCFHNVVGSGCFPPLLPKPGRLSRGEQSGRLKPPQKSVEIAEQLNSLAVLDGTCVQKIQSQVVSDKEEPALPTGFSS